MKAIRKDNWLALVVGSIAGIRSMAAPALVSHTMAHTQHQPLASPVLRFMSRTSVANILKMAAAAEVAGDKLPGMPDRTDTPLLIARALSGAFSAAVLYRFSGFNTWKGAIMGGLAAIAATYAIVSFRKSLSEGVGLPNKLVGAAEDAIVAGSSAALVHSS